MKHMTGKALALTTLIAVVVLLFMIETTTPASVGPLGIIFVFFLIYLSAVGLLTFLLFMGSKVSSRLRFRHLGADAIRDKALSLKKAYYYASVLGLAPVILIATQSIGRASVVDVVLVIIFEVLACIYLSKRNI